MIDAYEVLQVNPQADLDVIRAAFRTLARKYHPDFGGTGARMVSLNDAWAEIGDPKRRKAYDMQLAAAAKTGADGLRPAAPAGGGRDAGASWKPGAPTGTILDFGRYTGWSLVDLARQDPYYLEWLERTPIGRPMRSEIIELLERQKAAAPTLTVVKDRPRGRRSR